MPAIMYPVRPPAAHWLQGPGAGGCSVGARRHGHDRRNGAADATRPAAAAAAAPRGHAAVCCQARCSDRLRQGSSLQAVSCAGRAGSGTLPLASARKWHRHRRPPTVPRPLPPAAVAALASSTCGSAPQPARSVPAPLRRPHRPPGSPRLRRPPRTPPTTPSGLQQCAWPLEARGRAAGSPAARRRSPPLAAAPPPLRRPQARARWQRRQPRALPTHPAAAPPSPAWPAAPAACCGGAAARQPSHLRLRP